MSDPLPEPLPPFDPDADRPLSEEQRTLVERLAATVDSFDDPISADAWAAIDAALRAVLGHSQSAVITLDIDRGLVRFEASVIRGAAAEDRLARDNGRATTSPMSPAFVRALSARGLSYVLSTADGRTEMDRMFAGLGAGSYAIAPLAARAGQPEQVWLCIAWDHPDGPSPSTRALLRACAVRIGPVLALAIAREQLRRTSMMISELPSALLGLGPDGAIVELNLRARALVGAAVLGRPFESLFVSFDQAAVRAIMTSAAPCDSALVHLEVGPGEVIAVDLHLGAAPSRHGEVRCAQLTDARPRIASERAYEQRAATLSFVAELSEMFAGELDAQRGFERAASLLQEHIPALGVAVARANAHGALTGLVGAWGVPPGALAQLMTMRADVTCTEQRAAHEQAITSRLPPGSVILLRRLLTADVPAGIALFTLDRPFGPNARALIDVATRTFAVALRAATAIDSARALDAERRQLLDALPIWVFRVEADTLRTVFVNGAVLRAMGATGMTDAGIRGILVDPSERDRFDRTLTEAARSGSAAPFELRARTQDGRARVLRLRLHRLSDVSSGRAMIEGIAEDVTEELASRTQLVHTDRLASLGVLAAGVAHEINNPAAFLTLGVQQLDRLLNQPMNLPSGDRTEARPDPIRARIAEVVRDLAEGVQRISQIVGELRLFARIPEHAVSTPVDVNRLIGSAVTLTQAAVKSRARLELDLGELPPLPGDHARLGQVFVNLMVNAAQAIPPGSPEEHVVRVQTREEGDAVVVRVSDTGSGIAREHLGRVFEPFFTTKGPGEGTGLGLAISHDLVRRAGGTIEIQSSPGNGATFTVRLPVDRRSSSRPPEPLPRAEVQGGRVLLVEDEQALAVALSRELSARFHVEVAADGVLALDRLCQRDATFFSAVLCDLRIPGMDGPTLYETVRATRPEQAARFVFVTGGALSEPLADFLRACGRPVLKKPFTIEQLDAALGEVVAARAETR